MRQRLVGLDVLRFSAIALVLGRHMPEPPDTFPGAARSILVSWHRGGWVGVDLFFVLSGFLVSGLLFSEQKARGDFSILRFYARRGWRIYPPFLFLLVLSVPGRLFLGSGTVPLGRMAAELLFLQSYLPGLWVHTWSLAVEEHFYLLLPLILVMVRRVDRGSSAPFAALPAIAALLAVACLTLRLIVWRNSDSYSVVPYFQSHLRFDALFFGVVLSYAYHFHLSRFAAVFAPFRRLLIITGLVALSPAFILDQSALISTVGLSLFYVGGGMLLVGVHFSDLSRSRVARFLAMLGERSYSIYLWHIPVAAAVDHFLPTSVGFSARIAVYFLLSFVVGFAMGAIIERPALRLRDQWFPALGGSRHPARC